jgi:hypothetical protein
VQTSPMRGSSSALWEHLAAAGVVWIAEVGCDTFKVYGRAVICNICRQCAWQDLTMQPHSHSRLPLFRPL